MQFRTGLHTFAFIAAITAATKALPSGRDAIAIESSSVAETGRASVQTPPQDVVAIAGPDGAMDSEALVAEVLARNASIERAVEQLRAAEQRPAQARALSDPMFTYMLGPGSLESDDIDTAQKFEISQAFPWPGKRRLMAESAEFEAQGLRSDLHAMRQQLAFEARTAFVERWYAERAIEIYGENLRLLEEFEEIAQDKYAAGLVSKQDALQATVELEMLAHDRQVLMRERNRVEARINALLDRETAVPLPPPPPTLAERTPPPALDALQAAAMEQRPELAAAAAMIRSAESQSALAHKAYFPDFELMAGYDTFWGEEELRPTVGFSINLPVQRARRRAGVEEANATLSGAQAHARRTARDILLEVDEAYEWVHESIEAVALYDGRLMPAAEENLEAARSAYAAGEVDFLALLSAQKLLMDTTLRVHEARADYHMSLAGLGRATGAPSPGASLAQE